MSKLFRIIPFLIGFTAAGQQLPMYNHYLINPFVYNPAFTGSGEYTEATFVRNQRYSAFGQAAISNYVTVDGSLFNEKMGLGMILYNHNVGAVQQLASSLNYSYRLKINETTGVRLGISAGVLDTRLDYLSFNAEVTDDPYFASLRPNAPVFNGSAGASFYSSNFRIGISVPQITGGSIKVYSGSARNFYQLARHYVGMAEYDFHLGDKLTLRPVGLVRYVPGAPVQYDGTLMALYRKSVWLSATYKSDYAVQFNIGARVFDFLRVGYSYEYLIGKIAEYNPGVNHEIFLGISFRSKREKEIIREEVQVPDPKTVQERDSLAAVNQNLEDRLRQLLAEKQAEEKAMQRQLDSLSRVAAEPKVVVIPDTSRTTKPTVVTPLEKLEAIPIAKGYAFKELDGSVSADGFYVIAGVFGSRSNADRHLSTVQTEFPDSRLVINERNQYFYVVLHASNDQRAATQVFRKYKRKQSAKVWLLNYQRPIE